MKRRSFAAFVLAAAAVAATTHAVMAMSVTTTIDRLYEHRMFDVRRWPGSQEEGLRLAGTYMRERVSRETGPIALFAGSSVTHGYPWTQTQTFTHAYSRARGVAAINAGILGLDVSGVNDWIICAAKGNAVRPDTLVIEIPVVNTVAHLVNYRRAGLAVPPMNDCAAAARSPSYARWAWSKPLGIGWLMFLWEADAYPKDDVVIRVEPVPAGYFTRRSEFEAVAGEFEARVVRLLTNARTVAGRVYAFPSPVYTAGLAEIGEDTAAVQAQLARTVSACEQVDGVRCLDTAFLGERQQYFMNFTHLSQAGHRVMADWLAAHVH